jgi:hypothetical protein
MKPEKKKDMNSINVPLLQLVTREFNRDHVPRVGFIENPFFYFVVCLVFFAREEIRRMGNGEMSGE